MTAEPDNAFHTCAQHEPIDKRLHQLTISTVHEMYTRATEYLEQPGYKYQPKRRVRSVTRYDSGWPSVGHAISSKESDLISYSDLFAESVDSIRPIAFSEIASLETLWEYVESNESIRSRVYPHGRGPELADIRKSIARHIVRNLPTSILDRACASVGGFDGSDLDCLYAQRESSWLSPTLSSRLTVPVLLTDFEMSDSAPIGEGVELVRLTEDDLRAMSTDYDVSGVPAPLADAAWFALLLPTEEVENLGEGARLLGPAESDVTERVEVVFRALRIASQASTGWARVFKKPVGWSSGWKDALPEYHVVSTARMYPPSFDSFGWLRAGHSIGAEMIATLPAIHSALMKPDKQTALAVRRLSMALTRDTADDQLIDACIGLEALLGQKGAELSYRIALRTTALLSTRREAPLDPSAVFKMARRVYDRRSELVHGGTSDKHSTMQIRQDAPQLRSHDVAVFLLREVLRERLGKPASWSVEELDEAVLNGLSAGAKDED